MTNNTDESDIIEYITNLYKKILHREPDQTGIFYFLAMVKNNKMTLNDVKLSLFNSEEGQSIQNFSHYSDKYWNDLPEVVKYKNKLSTDDEDLHWIDDISNKFRQYIPFENVLIVGCGNGWLERMLFDKGIGKYFDSFDISEKYIKEAEYLKNNRPINYFIDDINNLQKIDKKKYDAVFNFAILHHAENLDDAMKKLSLSLKSDGLMFNEEYVGPAKNQYSDEHLQTMLDVMYTLPEKYRSKSPLRPPLANFRIEPSEAIHSDLVIPTFKKYFDTVYEKNMNGGIAYQILWNNIEQFENSDDPDAKKWLQYLLDKDIEYTKKKKIPVLFWYGVGKPKDMFL